MSDGAFGTEEKRLVSSPVGAVQLGADDIFLAHLLPVAIEESMIWVSPDGKVLATHMQDASTRVLYEIALVSTTSTLHAEVHGDRLWIMEEPSSPDVPVTFHVMDLETGAESRSFDIPGLSEKLSVNLVLRDFAIGPAISAKG